MSESAFVHIDDENKPDNIPDYGTLISRSFSESPRQTTATNISGVRLDLDKTSDLGVSSIWVKFGSNIRMGEAYTQRHVVRYLKEHNVTAVRAPRVYLAFTWRVFGFIVCEYIDAPTCEYSDYALVVPAVKALISIPSPGPTPGPVGGGLIEHPMFVDRTSCIEYESVEELQDHINGALIATRKKLRVDFAPELAEHGLRLCPSDIVPANFMKHKDGTIVAVDFAGYSFLPPSFFGFVMQHTYTDFPHRISCILDYPASTSPNVGALVSACCGLALYNDNEIGLPQRLQARLGQADVAERPVAQQARAS